MEPGTTETKSETEPADVLLDLGDIEPARASALDDSDDFVLDLDDLPVDAAPVYAVSPTFESQSASESASAYDAPMRTFVEPQVTESTYQPAVHLSLAETQEVPYQVTDIEPYEAGAGYEAAAVPPELTPDPVPVFGETEFPIADAPQAATSGATAQTATSISADQLSPEMIDAIARRCVELMSDKVIREIAWEVVPDLAELLIKRQLEERQTK